MILKKKMQNKLEEYAQVANLIASNKLEKDKLQEEVKFMKVKIEKLENNNKKNIIGLII